MPVMVSVVGWWMGGWEEGEAVFASVWVSTGFGGARFLRIGLKPVLKKHDFKEIPDNEFPFAVTAVFILSTAPVGLSLDLSHHPL